MNIDRSKSSTDERNELTVSRDELLRDGSDVRFRELVHTLLAFSVRLEAVRQEFGAYIGLSGSQYTILVSIAHLQGKEGIGVNAVARHLALSGAFVTIEVNKLVKLDLISKCTNPHDRHRVLLTASSKGNELLRSLAPVQREVNDVIFETLTAENFDSLLSLSGQLLSSSDNALALVQYLTGSKGHVT